MGASWNEQKNEWLEKISPELREQTAETLSGLPISLLYGPGEGPGTEEYGRKLGFPGSPPFTRGVYRSMYRGRLWTMRQYSGFGTPSETNRRFNELLDRGQTGLSMAFDLPTQMGYDADDRMAKGEVGRAGVSISTLDNMQTVFEDIPLADVSTSMTINATAPILVAMYGTLARKQGTELSQLRGTVQNDILKEYIARGTYIYPPGPSLRLTVDLMAFCSKNMPSWNSISVSGYHIREKGATAPQEIAFTLANALCYLRHVRKRDLSLTEVARRVSFFFSAHSDFFEEIAKFRAARRLWSRLLRDRFQIEDRKARRLRFHTQTAGVSLTAQQPRNNLVRVAFQALSAVLGGTQSLHTNAMDEALSIPTDQTATLALRTQQILAEETNTTEVIDPLGGAYYVENLTDRMEKKALSLINDIKDIGGARDAVRAGFFRNEIEESARDYQSQIEEGDRKIVGVNCFQEESEEEPDVLEVDPQEIERQREHLRSLRRRRNSSAVQNALEKLRKGARNSENLLPLIFQCVEAEATLGEISDELRDVFGEFDAG